MGLSWRRAGTRVVARSTSKRCLYLTSTGLSGKQSRGGGGGTETGLGEKTRERGMGVLSEQLRHKVECGLWGVPMCRDGRQRQQVMNVYQVGYRRATAASLVSPCCRALD
jgi:hypothetical protein